MASTRSMGTATCTGPPSSRTTSAWAPPATRRWSNRSGTSRRRRLAPADLSGPSHRASAPRRTTAGVAPTRGSVRTRSSSSRWRPPSTGSRDHPVIWPIATGCWPRPNIAGDGDTTYGTGSGGYTIDQGIAITNRPDFFHKALQQYLPAVQQHNVGTVMPSYSSVDWTEDGIVGNPIKMHGNKELITDVLKGSMNFGGFVISDWEGIHQLPGDWPTQVRTGVNAGIDMMMEPAKYQEFETTLTAEVNAGRVTMSRIDDAVSRILTKKFELGLFEHPYTDRTNLLAIGSPAHRAVARKAVAESQVLLKNAKQVLPISTQGRIYA